MTHHVNKTLIFDLKPSEEKMVVSNFPGRLQDIVSTKKQGPLFVIQGPSFGKQGTPFGRPQMTLFWFLMAEVESENSTESYNMPRSSYLS